jgi:hypothetical protein
MVIGLDVNGGKAEAVRAGMRWAIEHGAQFLGYADADMSTPVSEILRLSRLIESCDAKVIIGSRIRILGRDIDRTLSRHIAGRLFATCASIALNMPVYDTQCGAKFFRATPLLSNALAQPFTSRWAFDVELLGRLVSPLRDNGYVPGDIIEEPLMAWRDVAGSKLSSSAAVKATLSLARIAAEIRLRRMK